ncbi:MAG: hypothetical protein IT342_00865 [Candidatus Melainabacteria bacterium]|nr:hypothetical protein [Candidatus Melainabacteria bacterium]
MKRRIAVAICGLMVLATLFVCLQPKTAISSTSSSQAVPSHSLLFKKSFPACSTIPDPGHVPNLKDNGCGQPLIEANPTERLTHRPFLPR